MLRYPLKGSRIVCRRLSSRKECRWTFRESQPPTTHMSDVFSEGSTRMDDPSIFSRLCDVVDDLSRHVDDLPHGATKLALEVIVHRLDAIIDATVGVECVVPHDDEEVSHGA